MVAIAENIVDGTRSKNLDQSRDLTGLVLNYSFDYFEINEKRPSGSLYSGNQRNVSGRMSANYPIAPRFSDPQGYWQPGCDRLAD